jgi:tetratricopeptide (TPR) repeat protein
MLRAASMLCLGLLLLGPVGQAHEGPEHSIEHLTEHIRQDGESVPLLLRRASEYRVLGQWEPALADLKRVLVLEPNHEGALVELARIELERGRPDAALQWIQQAIRLAEASHKNQAHLYAVRGDVFVARADYAKALADYNRALAADDTQVDWYLMRSRMQELLNDPQERIKGLLQGYESTRSAVLYNEWVEALIDGGEAQAALRAIEPPLQQARLKSSWLIRRARARLALGNAPEYAAAARDDLEAAIAEINLRLSPARPDIDLLLDRALASLLSGDVAAARRDVAQAQAQGATARQMEKWRRYEKMYAPLIAP